jgi:amino acid transporter
MVIGEPAETDATATNSGLRRELSVVDAAAFSIGLIGPVGAMALLGVGAAGYLGPGATWAFIFAIIGVSLVAYGFIKLSGYIAHTGSVYALVGSTLGPRAGFIAGFALFGAYATIGTGSTIEIALFFNQFLHGIHIGNFTEWIWVDIVALAIVFLLSLTEIRVITRVLLISELIGAALVTILSVVVLIRTGTGHAPGGQKLTFDFLHLPHGTGIGTIAAAAVFGFLAFAGFEGAAALGEETLNPKREIPRAIKIAVIIVGAFFLLTIIGQSVGYGTDSKGVAGFVAGSPYGDLGQAYVGKVLAVLLNLVASLSLFAITLGTLNGAARISYALARDAGISGRLTRLSKRGAPLATLAVICVFVLIFMIGQRLAGTGVEDATFYWLTIGTIALLVAYALATVGAFRFLFLAPGPAKAPVWQAVIPVLGFAFVVYTIYKNVVGVHGPYRFFPYIVLVWLIVAALIVFSVRGLKERVRDQLASSGQL